MLFGYKGEKEKRGNGETENQDRAAGRPDEPSASAPSRPRWKRAVELTERKTITALFADLKGRRRWIEGLILKKRERLRPLCSS